MPSIPAILRLTITTTLLLFGCYANVFAQFSDSDVILTIKDLSEENASKFKAQKEALVEALNKYKVSESTKPIKVIVEYIKGEGNVTIVANYNNDLIFARGTDYDMHNENFLTYHGGRGITFWLQHQLAGVLSEYKFAVAREGFSIHNDLAAFESTIKLRNAKGETATCYAVNELDGRGFYPYSFYNNTRIYSGGKIYDVETVNSQVLNEMKFFLVGSSKELDGKISNNYYFSKFFNLPPSK